MNTACQGLRDVIISVVITDNRAVCVPSSTSARPYTAVSLSHLGQHSCVYIDDYVTDEVK